MEKELQEAKVSGGDQSKIIGQMQQMRKAVFVDEQRVEQRKAGFANAGKAKFTKAVALSEFM